MNKNVNSLGVSHDTGATVSVVKAFHLLTQPSSSTACHIYTYVYML